MPDAAVPYSLLRTLRACLDGTADQVAWDRARDELDDLLLAEPDGRGPVISAAEAIAAEKAAHPMHVVSLASQGLRERIEALPKERALPLSDYYWVRLADVLELFFPACSLCEAGHVPLTPCDGSSSMAGWDEPLRNLARMQREYLSERPGPEGDGDPC